MRILQPYFDAGVPGARFELFLVARLGSWTTTRHGGSVRDELSFDWPHDRDIRVWFEGIADELDPDLHLEIAAAGCPEVVTVRCTSRRCTVDP